MRENYYAIMDVLDSVVNDITGMIVCPCFALIAATLAKHYRLKIYE